MPLATIYVREGQFEASLLNKISESIQSTLVDTLGLPPEDFFQLIFEMPDANFRHTHTFVGMRYSDNLIILDLTFIQGRSIDVLQKLLKDLNARITQKAGISPDDLLIILREEPGTHFSFGRGETQRAEGAKGDPRSAAPMRLTD